MDNLLPFDAWDKYFIPGDDEPCGIMVNSNAKEKWALSGKTYDRRNQDMVWRKRRISVYKSLWV